MIKHLRGTTFQAKLVLSYLLIALLLLISVSTLFYGITLDTSLDLYKTNLSAVLKLKSEVIDSTLRKVEELANSMLMDQHLYDAFSQINQQDSSLIQADREITQIINRYIPSSDAPYTVLLATERLIFGTQSSRIPVSNFIDSQIYHDLYVDGQDSNWYPSYTVPNMFNLDPVNMDFPAEYQFSFANRLNLQMVGRYYNKFTPDSTSLKIMNPTLLVTFHGNYFATLLEGIMPVQDTFYFVLDQNQDLVYHTLPERISKHNPYDIDLDSDSIQTFSDAGVNYLLCHSRSLVTGWEFCAAIPYTHIGKSIVNSLQRKFLIILSILFVCSLIFAFVSSRMLSKPIRTLFRAIQKTGGGDFETLIQYDSKDEFFDIFSNFNQMNMKIKKLIETNYEATLRSQEAELATLHFQLNPHFLYNTLNIINLMIIKGENQLSSNMIVRLSQMLTYTTKTTNQKVPFSEDIEWLSNYFYVTNIRFGSRISSSFCFAPELNDCLVPKLFLQPFVENAILHGFKDRISDCTIKINGFIFDKRCVFEVEDNGCGIDPYKLERINQGSDHSVGIANVKQRIKLLYDEAQGVVIDSEQGVGTHVIITFPMECSEEAPDPVSFIKLQ